MHSKRWVWFATFLFLAGVLFTFNDRHIDSDGGLHAAAGLMLADGVKAVFGGEQDLRVWAVEYNRQFKSFGGWVYQEPVPHLLWGLSFLFFREIGFSGIEFPALFIPNILASITTIVLLYDFGREAYGEKAGRFSSLLFALSPSTVSFAKTILPGPIASLFLLLSARYLWKFRKKGDRKNSLLSGIFFALAVFSKYPIVVLAPFLGYLVWKKNRKRLLEAVGPSVLLGLLWLCVAFLLFSQPLGVFQRSRDMNKTLYFPRLIGYLPHLFLFLSTPFALLLFYSVVERIIKKRIDIPLIYAAYFLAPNFLFWPAFETFEASPCIMRFLLPCIPFFSLICAETLSRLSPRRVKTFFALMVITFVPFTQQLEGLKERRAYDDVLGRLEELEGSVVVEEFQVVRALYVLSNPEGNLTFWWQASGEPLETLLTLGNYEGYENHCRVDYYLGGGIPSDLEDAVVGEERFEDFVLYKLDPDKTCR